MTAPAATAKRAASGVRHTKKRLSAALAAASALTLGLALGPAALPAAAALQEPPRPELTPELTAELLTNPRGDAAPTTEPPIPGLVVKYAPGVVVPLSDDAPVPGAAAAGADLSPGDPVGLGWYEADLAEPVDIETAQQIAERLMADPAIEYAEPQFWVRPAAATTEAPNDPLWNRQWGFASYGDDTFSYPGTFPAYPLDRQTTGTNLVEALEAPRGDTPSVAVIDFGVTNHPDLAGRVTSGYNFISDPVIAGNGYGRGPDYSDPGSWVSAEMASELPLSMIPCAAPKATLWHGTHVTGTIAAITDNALGVAGSLPVEIQMLRALGTCDLGTYGDIGAAMLWAAGGTVPGVPANPSPARVVNMSLGAGLGYCPQFWQDAISYGTARGTVYVAAAGNSNGDAAEFAPANCAGVIAVAATDPYGGRTAFSNYGSYVDVAAPGVGIVSTYDSGLTSPQTPDYAAVGGTSMAAPHVTAAVAMLLAAEPDLTPVQVTERVRATATPFKQTANFGENGAPVGDPAYDCSGDDPCGTGYLNMAALMGQATADSPVVAPRYQVRNGEVAVSGADTGAAGAAGGSAAAGSGAGEVSTLASEVTVRFTFEPPASAPDDYEYTVSRGAEVLAAGTTTETDVSLTVPGGSREEFTVLITPRTGGVPGVAAQAMRVPSVDGSVPAAPTITAVSTSEAYAVIGVMNSFAVPNATSTRVTAQPGGSQCEIGAGSGSLIACAITDLEPGTEYTFTAVSSNAFGDSAPSAPVTATPQYGEGPTDPIIESIVTQGSTATISWLPAQAAPGRSIQLYVVRAFVDGELDPWAYCAAVGRWGEPEVNSCQLGNLVFGKAYEFVVIAQDNAGYASFSNFSDPVVPVGQPSPPTALTDPPLVVMGDGTATLAATTTWEPLNGGAPILGVRFVASPGGASCDIPWDDTVFASTCDIKGLTNGQPYTFRALVYNEMGASPLTDATVPLTPGVAPPAGELQVLPEPVRVLDTRDDDGPVVPGAPVTVDVDAPVGAIAVVYNLTITGTTGAGYATLYPAGEGTPATSVSNWSAARQTVANGYVSGLGEAGAVEIAVVGTPAQAVLDVVGFYVPPEQFDPSAEEPPPPGSLFLPMPPKRAYDSRTSGGVLSGGGARTVDLSTMLPSGAKAVAYTLTITGTTGAGYLSVGEPGADEPATSVINWTGPNQTVANSSTATVNQQRQIEVFAGASGRTQFIVDVLGYFAPNNVSPDGLSFTPISPTRAYDSRVDTPGGPLAGGENRTTSLALTVPLGAPAVAANLTATGTVGAGWLALTPGGTRSVPGTSTLNWWQPNTTVANGTVTGAIDDAVTTFAGGAHSSTQYILDVAGYYHRPRG